MIGLEVLVHGLVEDRDPVLDRHAVVGAPFLGGRRAARPPSALRRHDRARRRDASPPPRRPPRPRARPWPSPSPSRMRARWRIRPRHDRGLERLDGWPSRWRRRVAEPHAVTAARSGVGDRHSPCPGARFAAQVDPRAGSARTRHRSAARTRARALRDHERLARRLHDRLAARHDARLPRARTNTWLPAITPAESSASTVTASRAVTWACARRHHRRRPARLDRHAARPRPRAPSRPRARSVATDRELALARADRDQVGLREHLVELAPG